MKLMISMIASLLLGQSAMAADPAKQLTPDQAKMMAEWEKYSKPGDGHKALGDMVGEWKYKSKMWMSPGAKPETSEGEASAMWVLGERYVHQTVKGTAMGKPFEGTSLIGYDTFKQQYQSVWVDNMSTMMTLTTGKMDKKTKTLTETGVMPDAMDGMKDKPFRNETKFKNKNSFTFAMFSRGPDGKEYKCMEMEYTRK